MRVLFRESTAPEKLCYIEADYATVDLAPEDGPYRGKYELYIEALDWCLSAYFERREIPTQLLQKALISGYMDLTGYDVVFQDYSEQSGDGCKDCSPENCMDCDNTDCVYNPRHDN